MKIYLLIPARSFTIQIAVEFEGNNDIDCEFNYNLARF
jgi:hypothetical protein